MVKNAGYLFDEPFELGRVQFVQVEPDLCIANIIGQEGLKAKDDVPPVRYDAIRQGLARVADFANKHGASVHMPRIGCGLGGGRWAEVEKRITPTLTAREIDTFVYDFP